MKFLVAGNLSGRTGVRGNGGSERLSERTIHPIDIDELDVTISRLAPRLSLDMPDGQTIEFHIRQLDDFHPDVLFSKLDVFSELRDLRAQLHTPETYTEATARLRQLTQSRSMPDTVQDTDQAPPDSSTEDDKTTLERLLGQPLASRQTGNSAAESAVARLIDHALENVSLPAADPKQQLYFDAADELIGVRMRSILHHPDFQAMEALWRSIAFLVERLELDEECELFALDVSKQELLEDLSTAGNRPDQTEIFRLLIEQGVQIPGTEPWSLLVGNFSFDPSERDVSLLTALGTLASQAGGPFIAQAHPALLGCDSLLDIGDPRKWRTLVAESRLRWQALRDSIAAQWIGLALPRLLVRLPYGSGTDEIDAFSFQEILRPEQEHSRFLWGNPAFGCALLMIKAFQEGGSTAGKLANLDINDLPIFSYRNNHESKLKPCAEVLLPDGAADAMLASGLIPVMSKRNAGSSRIPALVSLSDPLRVLAKSTV